MSIFQQNLTDLRHIAFRMAFALIKDREKAEDVVQEILLKLWSMKEDVIVVENLQGHLLKMTRNRCLDIFVQMESSEEIEEDPNQDRFEKAMTVLDQLPEIQRTVLQLRDVEGFDFPDIADILEIEEGSVRTHLSEARKRVRDALTTVENHEH